MKDLLITKRHLLELIPLSADLEFIPVTISFAFLNTGSGSLKFSIIIKVKFV